MITILVCFCYYSCYVNTDKVWVLNFRHLLLGSVSNRQSQDGACCIRARTHSNISTVSVCSYHLVFEVEESTSKEASANY